MADRITVQIKPAPLSDTDGSVHEMPEGFDFASAEVASVVVRDRPEARLVIVSVKQDG